MSLDYALYRVSYANMVMLMATLPSYSSSSCRSSRPHGAGGGAGGAGSADEVIDADDPRNRERIIKMFT